MSVEFGEYSKVPNVLVSVDRGSLGLVVPLTIAYVAVECRPVGEGFEGSKMDKRRQLAY